MRSGGIINAQLSRLLSELRHTDLLVISDSGLPVLHGGPEIIDLAVVYGVPSFEAVFRAVVAELVIEAGTAAAEITEANPVCWTLLQEALGHDVELVSHETFKKRTAHARAIVRTGEATPYANVLLRCGVPFGRP
jgi:D-ribose pyranase